MSGFAKVCAWALLAAFPVVAQTPYPLKNLKIEGNRRIPVQKIAAVSGLKLGALVTKADFDQARTRLMATGAFENVGYEYKPSADKTGFDATIEVTEVEQIFPYRFEDLPVRADTLRAALRKQEPILGDEIPATKEVIARYVNAIQQLVGSKVKVTGQINSDIPGKLMIVFRPNTPRDQVAEVKFAGNQVLPSALLVRTLAEEAVGTAYSEVTMRTLLDSSVRPLYEARGRLRVTFPRIETKASMLSEGVAVIVTVDEGPSYSLGEVSFSGVSPAELPEVRKAANLQSKDIADFDEIKAGMDRVLARYRSKGYLRASEQTRRQIDDASHRVNITAVIDAGPQFTMGKLEILGLDLTSEPTIRKMWKLTAGTPFEAGYPDAFLDDIRKQDLFDNLGKTRSETTVDEKTRGVDVKLYFSSAAPDSGKDRRKKGN